MSYEDRLKYDFLYKNRNNQSQNLTASGIHLQDIVVGSTAHQKRFTPTNHTAKCKKHSGTTGKFTFKKQASDISTQLLDQQSVVPFLKQQIGNPGSPGSPSNLQLSLNKIEDTEGDLESKSNSCR